VARLCGACKKPLRWGTRQCPECGEDNPTVNTADVVLMTLVGGLLAFAFFKLLFRQLS
jgi:RNA polymerase subunit RPABC4/transcription elongation factor Spt4